jgi:hypothetical protein
MKTWKVTREVTVTITIRRFDEADWRLYSGCEAFDDGSDPYIAEVEDVGAIIADKGGLCFERLDPGALNGVTQYGYNMTLKSFEAGHAVEILARMVAQGEHPDAFFGHPRKTIL